MGKDFDIALLRAAVIEGRIQWHLHALERFLERGISRAEVISAILQGEVIEVYTTDRPYPSGLILHVETEPVHVVAAAESVDSVCHVITAYRPDLERFEADYKTRRKKL
jgi:hypothetical protein